jgi:hypothetical protein
MAGMTYKEQTEVRGAIKDYLDENGMTSLRKVCEYVESVTGIYPAPTTIARLVREFGYDSPQQTDWKWQKVK